MQGIVGKGYVLQKPYLNYDWRTKDWLNFGRKIFYADFRLQYWVNPECAPFIESSTLEKEIPDFDWFGGHSGVFLRN